MRFLSFIICINLSISAFSQSITETGNGITGFVSLNFAEVSEVNNIALIGGTKTYLSTDGGFNWSSTNNSFGTPLYGYTSLSGTILSSTSFVISAVHLSGGWGVFKTVDAGNTWTQTLFSASQEFGEISSHGTNVILAASNGVYVSSNAGVSWNWIQLSSGGEISDVVEYNIPSNKWLINNYSGNFKQSSNNGTTWNDVVFNSYSSANNTGVSTVNNHHLFTNYDGQDLRLFTTNGINSITDSIHIVSSYFYGGDIPISSVYLPSGDILTYSDDMFYNIDTSNHFVYTHQYYGANTSITDLDFDQTYGLAVSTGEVHRIDFTQPSSLYVPSNFYGGLHNCSGDTIQCVPQFPFSDSLQWFYNGQLLSNDSTFTFVTPNDVFGGYTVELHSWYNGNEDITTKSGTTYAPLPPSEIWTVMDTTPCFDALEELEINMMPGSSLGSWYEIWLGGQMVESLQPLMSNNEVDLPALIQDDTLFIYTSYPQVCGTGYDTTFLTLEVGNDMSLFSTVPNEDLVCSAEVFPLELLNTIEGANYDFELTNSLIYNDQWNTSGVGVLNDTLTVLLTAFDILQNPHPSAFGDVFLYCDVTITDNDGCVYEGSIDTFMIQRPDASFLHHSRSFYNSDTVALSNTNITENRLWEVLGLATMAIPDPNDTIPIVIVDTTGFYPIKLTNTPLPDCTDSVQYVIHFCDSLATNSSQPCLVNELNDIHIILNSKIDNEGNMYNLGVYSAGPWGAPVYIFAKYDSNGVLLWEKKGAEPFSGGGAIIEDFDFDDNGYPYCVMWVDSEYNYSSNYVSYSVPNSGLEMRSYIMKVDKNTGDLIWRKDVSTYPNFDYAGIRWRVTDIVVANNKVYFSEANKNRFTIVTTDLNGNYIAEGEINPNIGAGSFLNNNFAYPNGSGAGSSESYWSPQLGVLSTGEIIAVAKYNTTANLSPYSQLMTSSSNGALLATKYTETDGIYELTKIAELGDLAAGGYGNPSGKPHFGIDHDDNISFGVTWEYGDSIFILDSLMFLKSGTAVFQTDSDFNLKWITIGRHMSLQDFGVATYSGDVFVAGKTKDNISFGNDQNHYMSGDYGEIPQLYNYVPMKNINDSLNHKKYEGFVIKFDSLGVPSNSKMYKIQEGTVGNEFYQLKASVTPCGDLNVILNNRYETSTVDLMIDHGGSTFALDSTLIFKYESNCIDNSCEIFVLPDTALFCTGNSGVYFESLYSFGVDSVNYSIIESGVTTLTSIVSIDEGQIFFPVPTSINSNFELVINSPQIDTVFVNYTSSMPPTYHFVDTVCYGEIVAFWGTPSNSEFSWLDGYDNDHTLVYEPSLYTSNLTNYIDVVYTDNVGCVYLDTLSVFVHDPIVPGFFANYNIECEDTLELVYNENVYISDTWVLDGLTVDNFFTDQNLNYGVNNLTVTLIDSIGCTTVRDIPLIYCLDASVVDLQLTSFDIRPNPNSGEFEISFSNTVESFHLGIFSSDGKEVYKNYFSNLDKVKLKLDVEPGVYFVEISSEGKNFRKKILIH